LSLKLTPNPKSILGQNNRDFTRNNKSTNYNDYNNISVMITVIVSLIGSLRKGYGLTDDVASYSST
jgi:hypothetical protein